MKRQALYIIKELLLLSILSLAGTVSFEQNVKEMFAKKEILPDTSLTNNCDQWKVTSSGKRKVAFGPFKIIAADFGKTKKLNIWLTTSGEEEIKIMLGSFMAAYISALQN